MVSIDLKEAYLQIPVNPESCKYLWFVAFGRVYQFRALCFGLASAPPGLHTCYGSCFVNLAFHGYSSSSLFRRLVNPVFVSGGGSSRPSGGP